MGIQTVATDVPKERTFLEMAAVYLTIALRHRWLVVIATVIAVLAAVVFSIISLRLPPEQSPLPNTYRATAVLLMQRESGTDLDSALQALGLAAAGEPTTNTTDYAQLAVRVLDRLAEEFGIAQKYASRGSARTGSRKAILSGMSVDYDRITGALTLGYHSVDPQFSHDMVARMVELLDEWFATRGGTSRLKQKLVLEQKLADISVDISRLEEQIREFQERYGGLTVDEIAASQAKILDGLRAQLLLKEMEIQNYTRFVKIEDPNLARMTSERDNLNDQIKRIEGGLSIAGGTVMPAKQDLPELALRFDNMNRALQVQKGIYQALSQQYELVKLYLQSQPAFQVLEPAEVPDLKSGPSRGKLCVAATVLSLFIALAFAFAVSGIEKLRRDPSALKRLIGRSA